MQTEISGVGGRVEKFPFSLAMSLEFKNNGRIVHLGLKKYQERY